jgi:hypothetical protein
MIDALLSIPTAAIPTNYHSGAGNRVNGIRWRDATATQRNNWETANSDRSLSVRKMSNTVAGNVASSLANVGTAADKMTAAVGSFMKRKAEATTEQVNWPAIKPWQLEGTGGVLKTRSCTFASSARVPSVTCRRIRPCIRQIVTLASVKGPIRQRPTRSSRAARFCMTGFSTGKSPKSRRAMYDRDDQRHCSSAQGRWRIQCRC